MLAATARASLVAGLAGPSRSRAGTLRYAHTARAPTAGRGQVALSEWSVPGWARQRAGPRRLQESPPSGARGAGGRVVRWSARLPGPKLARRRPSRCPVPHSLARSGVVLTTG